MNIAKFQKYPSICDDVTHVIHDDLEINNGEHQTFVITIREVNINYISHTLHLARALFVHVCVCVCVFVHMCVFVHACVHLCVMVRGRVWVCVCVGVWVFLNAHMCMHVRMCMRVCVRACMHVHVCACGGGCLWVCACVFILLYNRRSPKSLLYFLCMAMYLYLQMINNKMQNLM